MSRGNVPRPIGPDKGPEGLEGYNNEKEQILCKCVPGSH